MIIYCSVKDLIFNFYFFFMASVLSNLTRTQTNANQKWITLFKTKEDQIRKRRRMHNVQKMQVVIPSWIMFEIWIKKLNSKIKQNKNIFLYSSKNTRCVSNNVLYSKKKLLKISIRFLILSNSGEIETILQVGDPILILRNSS